jgi:hypothetical protein
MSHPIAAVKIHGSCALTPSVAAVRSQRLPLVLTMTIILLLGWALPTQVGAEVIVVTQLLGGGTGTLSWVSGVVMTAVIECLYSSRLIRNATRGRLPSVLARMTAHNLAPQ